jgi:hypothetical protein
MALIPLGKWDNGTMETETFPIERPAGIYFLGGVKNTTIARFEQKPVQLGPAFSRTGNGSLQIQAGLLPIPEGGPPPSVSLYTYLFGVEILSNASLSFDTRYTVTCYVFVPSAGKIAEDDAIITLVPPEVLAGLRNAVNPVWTNTTVGAALDTWVQISYEFTLVSGVSDFRPRLNVIADGIENEFPQPQATAEMGNDAKYLVGGALYVDDFQVDEDLAAVCDLAFDAVPVEVTNETAPSANDGQITVNATSSNPIEYSLDDVTYQPSNVFTGLAPGVYTVYARDTLCTINTSAEVIRAELTNCVFNAASNPNNFIRFQKILDISLGDLQNNGLPISCEEKQEALPVQGDFNNDFNNDFLL